VNDAYTTCALDVRLGWHGDGLSTYRQPNKFSRDFEFCFCVAVSRACMTWWTHYLSHPGWAVPSPHLTLKAVQNACMSAPVDVTLVGRVCTTGEGVTVDCYGAVRSVEVR